MDQRHSAPSQREALEMLIKEYYEKMMKYRTESAAPPTSEDKPSPLPENKPDLSAAKETEEIFPLITDNEEEKKPLTAEELIGQVTEQLQEEVSPAKKEVSSPLPDFFYEWEMDHAPEEPAKERPTEPIPDSKPVMAPASVFASPSPVRIPPLSPSDCISAVQCASGVPIPLLFFDKGVRYSGTFRPLQDLHDVTDAPFWADPSRTSPVLVRFADLCEEKNFAPAGMFVTWPESNFSVCAVDRETRLSPSPKTAVELIELLSQKCPDLTTGFLDLCSRDSLTVPYLISCLSENKDGTAKEIYRTPYTIILRKRDRRVPVRLIFHPQPKKETASSNDPLCFTVRAQFSHGAAEADLYDGSDSDPVPLSPADIGILTVDMSHPLPDAPADPLCATEGILPMPDPFVSVLMMGNRISMRRSGHRICPCEEQSLALLSQEYTCDDPLQDCREKLFRLSDEEKENLCRKTARLMHPLTLAAAERLLEHFAAVDPSLRTAVEQALRRKR